MTDGVIWDGTFLGRFEQRQFAVRVFERHTEEVKWRVPPDRLLVYELGSGWEPLCDVLGVEVPEGKPFPQLNDTDAFHGEVRRRFVLPVALPVMGGLLAGAALLYLRRP